MTKRLIPLASMELILKKSKAERVSLKAKEALKQVVEAKAEEIAKTAVELATHAGRRTIKKEDVILAAKKFKA